MKHIHLVAAATLAALLQGCVTPKYSSDGVGLERESFIPFANQRSAVASWQADGREGVWVQDGLKQWYYAKMFTPCQGLDQTIRLGFDTGTSDRLDRFSHVIVPNQSERCAIMSFTESEPPPDGKRRSLDGTEAK